MRLLVNNHYSGQNGFPRGLHGYADHNYSYAINYAIALVQEHDPDGCISDGIVRDYGNDEQKELYFELKELYNELGEVDANHELAMCGEIGKLFTRLYEEITEQMGSMIYNSIENVLNAPMKRPLKIGKVELICLDDEADVRDYMR